MVINKVCASGGLRVASQIRPSNILDNKKWGRVAGVGGAAGVGNTQNTGDTGRGRVVTADCMICVQLRMFTSRGREGAAAAGERGCGPRANLRRAGRTGRAARNAPAYVFGARPLLLTR